MNILALVKDRFRAALAENLAAAGNTTAAINLDELVGMIRPSQDAKFGDYQANCAMPLGKQFGRSPRDVASEIVARLKLVDEAGISFCEPPEIAGPGFINLRVKNDWLAERLLAAARDPRLGVAAVARPRTIVVDFSAPNVAKPMHVGHIRSTVIGDSLARVLRFLGHNVITDNHLGDWGTQFGMIIYGYRNFLDAAAYAKSPVEELARLYRLVHKLADYHAGRARLPEFQRQVVQQQAVLEKHAAASPPADPKAAKQAEKTLKQLQKALAQSREDLAALERKLGEVDSNAELTRLAAAHMGIGQAVLAETAKLHAGDEKNLKLWRQFLPACLSDIQRIYDRLGVSFDHTLGESFYHDRLAPVVDDLLSKGIARPSEGAIAVFLPEQATPMLVRKQDGAFLYATTDLATIQYRLEHWRPDAILYVVDHRQGLHFEQLFAAARLWGCRDVELQHVAFGTVLGDDGRPYKTRSGDTVGLSGLLDEAVERALAVVRDADAAKPTAGELSRAEQQQIAETVGIAALKYADLSQNRTSDYVFSYDKMLALTGNTATYMQYAYARVHGIFAKGQIEIAKIVNDPDARISLDEPAERALGLEIARFAEALDDTVADYRPNHLTNYLFALANRFATFFEQCPVLKAESDSLRRSRLLLCELTARTLQQGLELLGIQTLEKM